MISPAEIDALVARCLDAYREAVTATALSGVQQIAILNLLNEAAAALGKLKGDAERIRAQTIEECARVCDTVRTDIAWRKIDIQYGEGCEECARSIRQLASSAGSK